ncbi:MAG TPA: DUF4430 domain-containing protein [Candidatus Paceibacterota bacterium]|nr:DUF4430 domain-containing protein [Candidatus Paceibacterota bacterium]
MKDHLWLATFSVFTLVVGLLFTYGNGTKADTELAPVQVFVSSTTTPAAPVVIREGATAPPVITVNVLIATSSLEATVPTEEPAADKGPRTYYVTNNTTYTTEVTSQASTTPVIENDTVTLSVQGIYTATSTAITDGETVLALLSRLDATYGSLGLATKDYGDMGVLVTAMGGLVNGTDGKYWQYTVNGTMPLVGADQYELRDGETLSWEFKGF